MINEEDDRPNPEELLKIVQKNESDKKRGKLKIFLGMAAGVGKTYAMLQAAHEAKNDKIDVVVGVIDTHGRVDTAKLLEGLEIIPELVVSYKDVLFSELDLDAILKRKPKLVLIDELAHSNVPGSRHPKRWHDVVEILDHGIDVFTTLNVQHIESLKDVVEVITETGIRETVPDLVIDTANFIELIDITTDALLRRLKEGKVYLGNQSTIAEKNFFKEDRLTALREIVLRYTAEKVDRDLKGMFSSVERADAWKLRERLLVAVSHSSHSQKLIRITRRLASTLDAPWIALHIDSEANLDLEDQEMLAKNLTLARDLGGEVITTSSNDVAEAIKRVARQKSVTQIIIGRSPTSWPMSLFVGNSLLDRLAKECSDLDLHVIRKTIFNKSSGKGWNFTNFYKKFSSYIHSGLSSYLLAFLLVVTLTVINWFSLPSIGYEISGFIFLLGILFSSLFFRKGPILFASILSALMWTLFFIPDGEISLVSRNQNVSLLIIYFITAVFTGILVERTRKNKEMLIKREKSIEALYSIVQEITTSPSTEQMIESIKDRLDSVFDCKSEIFLKTEFNTLSFDKMSTHLDEKEQAAANWVFLNGKEAGWSTSTLPSANFLYLPLKNGDNLLGVLAFRSKTDREPNLAEKNFLYTVGQQLSNYLDRTFADEKARQYEHHLQIEKTYQSILNLISNLFEGPLAILKDAVKKVKSQEKILALDIQPAIEQLENSTETLARILENISAMVNLSAGLIAVNRQMHDLAELIRVCYERIKKTKDVYRWNLEIDQTIPPLFFDYDLIELLIYNLTFHAIEFAQPDSQVTITCKQVGDYIVTSVIGEGQSIPSEIVDAAFEQFYRLPGNNSGLGLGLQIAKTIAEIHEGQLKVETREEGGMIFSLYLPLTIK